MKISALFVGDLHDNGFNASALAGIESEQAKSDHQISVVCDIPYDEVKMIQALEKTANESDLVIFIGGQGDKVTPQIAADFPRKRFAVIQGSVSGSNLFSYEVKQEQSAFLAGVFAAAYTKSRTIGHLSGHRVKPGLKGRAAYVAGAKYADPGISVLTSFCGTQDKSPVAQAWAEAQISNGADIIFTMLNGARSGVIEACRSSGIKQIGNAKDWCAILPEIFVASAIANIGVGVRRAIRDAEKGTEPTSKVEIGLGDENTVSLSMHPDVGEDIRAKVSAAERVLRSDELSIPEIYEGQEFQLEQ